ncbi:DNA mismatch repair protein [Tanacetum coccineum]
MHVVKNVAESLTGTLFNIKGKTKDTWKSRKDLMDKGLKKSLHLVEDAKKGGPFQYRWMFPFERKMRTLKGYVKNTAHPEGCIAERSLDSECLNFCSMYLNDVETIFNKVERNNEMVDIDGWFSWCGHTPFGVHFVFSCKGRPLGSKITRDISNIELEKIDTYILNNCDKMVELINEHKLKLEKENSNNINELHEIHFAHGLQEVNNCPESFEFEIRLLSRGPFSVNEYSGCMVNGFKFHTQSRETNRKTQHNQPYILASQAKHVFYTPDLKLGKNWHVVLSNALRKVFNVPVGNVYQEKEPQLNLNVDLNLEQSSLRRGSTPLELVDAITLSGDSTRKSSKPEKLLQLLKTEAYPSAFLDCKKHIDYKHLYGWACSAASKGVSKRSHFQYSSARWIGEHGGQRTDEPGGQGTRGPVGLSTCWPGGASTHGSDGPCICEPGGPSTRELRGQGLIMGLGGLSCRGSS